MGYVNVQVGGSFVGHFGMTSVTERFSALENGHADAVARAIEYLSAVVLPRSIALDHELQTQGAAPSGGFTPKRITSRPSDSTGD